VFARLSSGSFFVMCRPSFTPRKWAGAMSKQFTQNEKKLLNDQAVIRAMCPRDTVKWLAQMMGISLHAARVWVERTVPVYRREEFGLRLLEKYYAKRKWEDENVLPSILHMAGLGNEPENVSTAGIAFAASDLVGVMQDQVEAAIDWLEE
jgi:hypothetical protein